ncbi:MAG: hybrid sensor histidine kinase/response regulator [Proteobacteria bacterium]|nr:hybrid sensor histidine kinase/response regulator [Pseudomonadota bacterium]
MSNPHSASQWRIPVLLALIAAAFLIFSGVAIALYEENIYRAQQVKDFTEQASILAANETAAVVFGDRKAAQEYVDAMKVNPELQAVAVYDRSGRLMASTSRVGPVPYDLGNISQLSKLGLLAISVPVAQQKVKIGTVYIWATEETPQRRTARYLGIGLLVVMGALVLIVLGVSQRALARANRELEARAESLAVLNLQLQTEMEERRKTEEALRQSQKMEAIGQLSGGIAHDFNNLLMIAMGNLQLLQRRLGEDAKPLARYIESAEEGLRRAANLTQRLLAFARRQPLTPRPVNLSGLIEGMRELIDQSVGHRVETALKLDAQWSTLCDVNQMENVILNLAINARDAMPDGGKLSIETTDLSGLTPPLGADGFATGDYIELRVCDDGEGMSEDTRRQAIDPFFTTKPMGQGTGLGLSTAFGFVRQSGGYLGIESAPGSGTIITILLPRSTSDESPQT